MGTGVGEFGETSHIYDVARDPFLKIIAHCQRDGGVCSCPDNSRGHVNGFECKPRVVNTSGDSAEISATEQHKTEDDRDDEPGEQNNERSLWLEVEREVGPT